MELISGRKKLTVQLISRCVCYRRHQCLIISGMQLQFLSLQIKRTIINHDV